LKEFAVPYKKIISNSVKQAAIKAAHGNNDTTLYPIGATLRHFLDSSLPKSNFGFEDRLKRLAEAEITFVSKLTD